MIDPTNRRLNKTISGYAYLRSDGHNNVGQKALGFLDYILHVDLSESVTIYKHTGDKSPDSIIAVFKI